MPKRKATQESEEGHSSSASPKPASKLPRRVREHDQKVIRFGEEDTVPLSKKAKKGSEQIATTAHVNIRSRELSLQANSNGEKFIDLGKKKRATVRAFKGIPLIDIREYYGAGNELQPGKKGISLTIDQWEALKKGSGLLDDVLSALNKDS
ncbi:transcriptional Coactivator p15-domain-containing protein [Cyathus striatus]|nr:transcriptional Coactivator p15-domain-containing protein [Cyathus striatus]